MPISRLLIIELAALIALLLLGTLSGGYEQTIVTKLVLLSLLAISFDLCWGYSGIMAFGQALFFGSAGYVVALLNLHWSVHDFFLVAFAGALTGAVGSALVELLHEALHPRRDQGIQHMVPLFSLSADLGLQFLVQAFLAVMLGGVGTFEGPVLGGALMGSLIPGVQWAREYLGIADLISPVAGEVFIYVLILLTVKMRPQGILRRN